MIAMLSTPQAILMAAGITVAYYIGQAYVKKNATYGGLIAEIEKANKEYHFHNIKESYDFVKEYRDEEYFYSVKPLNYLDRVFCEDIQTYGKLVTHIKENREMEEPYKKVLEEIFCSKTYNKRVPFIYRATYRRAQKKEARKRIQKPITNPTFNIIIKCGEKAKVTTLYYDNLLLEMEVIKKKLSDKERKKYERAILTDRLRYKILRRDKFKCVLCGRSAGDGAVLHIDHIRPVSKGGTTEWRNLRTLCEQCNRGKSDMIE